MYKSSRTYLHAIHVPITDGIICVEVIVKNVLKMVAKWIILKKDVHQVVVRAPLQVAQVRLEVHPVQEGVH